jgi:hypothetical protein
MDDRTEPRRKRAKRYVESPEIGAMMGRMLRSGLVRRAVEDHEEQALVELVQLHRSIGEAIQEAGRGMAAPGEDGERMWTYGDLGRLLGITRQSARERFGPVSDDSAGVDRYPGYPMPGPDGQA